MSKSCRGRVRCSFHLSPSAATFPIVILGLSLKAGGEELGGYWSVHSDDITSLQFHSQTQHRLLTGSTDGLVNILDLSKAEEEEARRARRRLRPRPRRGSGVRPPPGGVVRRCRGASGGYRGGGGTLHHPPNCWVT